MRSRRGFTMVELLTFLLATLAFLAGLLYLSNKVTGGSVESFNGVVDCQSDLMGELAGGKGKCFTARDCRTSSDGKVTKGGEWLYVGEKGCQEATEGKANFCCMLFAKEGDRSAEALEKESCENIGLGKAAFLVNGACIPAEKDTKIDISSPFKGIFYRFDSDDPKIGIYSAQIIFYPNKGEPFNILIRPTQSATGTEDHIVITSPIEGEDIQKTMMRFVVSENGGEYLANLTDGGKLTLRINTPLKTEKFTVENMLFDPPANLFCPQGSTGGCAEKIPGVPFETDSNNGLQKETTCTYFPEKGHCEASISYKNSKSVKCIEVSGAWIRGYNDCVSTVPDPVCKRDNSICVINRIVRATGSGFTGYCSLYDFDEITSIGWRDLGYDPAPQVTNIPDCVVQK